jgi:hypothetical protein
MDNLNKMIDLPKGFPKYCKDLKQIMDECANNMIKGTGYSHDQYLEDLKNNHNYPKQTNAHNALADARWNRDLYKFLTTI